MIVWELSNVFQTAKNEIENGSDPVEVMRGAMLGALHAAKRNPRAVDRGIVALEKVEVPVGTLVDVRR